MKVKAKTLIVILTSMILVLGVLTSTVKAAHSAKIEMVPEQTEVRPGETIEVVVNLTGVENAVDAEGNPDGINFLGGDVEYDENFFDDIGVGEIGPNGFLLESDEGAGLTEDGQFTVIEFKVSDTATGTSTVKFTRLSTANATDETTSEDITLTFTVSDEEEPENPEEPNGVDPNGTQGGNNDDDNNGVRNNSIRGNSSNGAGSSGGTSKSKLPDAGWGKGIIIGAAILIVITAGSYFLYKKYQKI